MALRHLAARAMSLASCCSAASKGCGALRSPAPLPSKHLSAALLSSRLGGFTPGQLHAGQGLGLPSVAARSYAYDAAAAPAAEIGEVDFDPAVANTVRLIGVMGMKQEMKVFERSKLLPFSLGIKTDRRNPDAIEWLQVEAWGSLAERVDEELQKGEQLAVQGRIKMSSWQDRQTGNKRTAIRLQANTIARVRRTGGQGGMDDGYGGEYTPSTRASSGGGAPWDEPLPAGGFEGQSSRGGQGEQRQQGGQEEQLWIDYFTDPSQWVDQRTSKMNPKAPDFKKREGGRNAPALWLNSRNCPPWVDAELTRNDDLRRTVD